MACGRNNNKYNKIHIVADKREGLELFEESFGFPIRGLHTLERSRDLPKGSRPHSLKQVLTIIALSQKPFECNTCDYKSAYRRNLEIHVKKNHGNFGQNKSGSILKRAQRTLHDLCNKLLPKECKDCALRFPLFQDVINHARDFHAREDLLVCTFCKKQHKTRYRRDLNIDFFVSALLRNCFLCWD